MPILGIDCSYYGGLLTADRARQMVALDYDFAIVGSWHGQGGNPFARDSLKNCREAGMVTGTYTALNSRPGDIAVLEAKRFCGDEWDKLKIVAIDCEVDGITPTIINQAIATCTAEGKVPIIYTAYWWWHDHFGNYQGFKHVPLWSAFYDNDPDIDFGRLPYGGWTLDKLLIEQYMNTNELAGHSVDRNIVANETLWRTILKEEGMTDEERAAFEAAKGEAEKLRKQAAVAKLFNTLSAKALNGQTPTEQEKAAVRWLVT